MIDIITKLTDLTNTNYRDKFSNELEALADIEGQGERVTYLQQILSSYEGAIQASMVAAAVTNAANEVSNDPSKDNDNIIATTDRIIYSREWKRLAPIHRIIKLKEYLEFLPASDCKTLLITQLEELVNSKKLKDPEHVIYNHERQRVMDIPCLSLTSNDDLEVKYSVNL